MKLMVPGLHIYTFSIDQPSKVQMCKPGKLSGPKIVEQAWKLPPLELTK